VLYSDKIIRRLILNSTTILLALIGLAIGGAINQLADVLPHRHRKLSDAACAACGQPRPAIQAIAVLAYLAGKRACPACGRTIAVRNVIVELVTAGLFVLLYSQPQPQPRFAADPILLMLACFHTAVLVLVTVTDFEHRLIPNRAILPAMLIAALTSWRWFWHEYWYVALVGGLIGYGFFWLAATLGNKFLGRGAMGGGDVKLAAYVGLITGFPGIITALVVTILAGGIISLVLLLLRVVNLRSGIPYGPFIALGGFVTMVWGQQIVTRFFFGA
jgi:leader peptidase (prepilin peptidase) / N-methyltransferase